MHRPLSLHGEILQLYESIQHGYFEARASFLFTEVAEVSDPVSEA